MLNINLHSVIDSEGINKEAQMFGYEGQDYVFSLDSLQRILNEHPEEKELTLNINCDGGSVSEGLAIYDVLRTSGKTIYANIEGGCHSMAVVLLLAAPKENRSANPNCRALIHQVAACSWRCTSADDYRALADEIEREQNAIIDIYAERTGYDRDKLEAIMKEEKMHTAQELLEWGFISKINVYTTNQKTSTDMADKMTKKGLIKGIANFLGVPVKLTNFDHKDADGNVLFSTEREDETLQVGDAATPDGTFPLPDGRTVVIEGGVIASITEPEPEPEPTPDPEPAKDPEEDLKAENAALKAENEDLKAKLADATNLLTAARNELQSSYTPEPRNTNVGTPTTRSAAEIKEEARKALQRAR